MDTYDIAFYKDRYEFTRFAAESVLAIVQRAIPKVTSAIDVGCGVGTWLKVLTERGASDITGIDGAWVHRESLVIPSERFIEQDLSREDLPVEKKYDLAISLEVAEHLPPYRAEPFVAQLARLGDFVLFSAAIPGQGGTNHINEQWPEYWIQLFEKNQYVVFDIIRAHIWTDERIPVHYKQNALLFVKRARVSEVKLRNGSAGPGPVSMVHPRLFLNKLEDLRNPTITQSVELLGAAVVRRIKRQLGIGR